VIGTGSFGDVFVGTWKGQRVAIKQFMKQKVTDEILLEMRTESGILRYHQKIFKFSKISKSKIRKLQNSKTPKFENSKIPKFENSKIIPK
jgi:serine/threonine protein kinase